MKNARVTRFSAVKRKRNVLRHHGLKRIFKLPYGHVKECQRRSERLEMNLLFST